MSCPFCIDLNAHGYAEKGVSVDELRAHFSERGIVAITSTYAKVNFWDRLIQGLGVGPAGFSNDAPFLDITRFTTRRE